MQCMRASDSQKKVHWEKKSERNLKGATIACAHIVGLEKLQQILWFFESNKFLLKTAHSIARKTSN